MVDVVAHAAASGDGRLGTWLHRRTLGLPASERGFAQGIVHSRGFPHSHTLTGHTGCVNAIAFSHRDSRLLASGSDDQRVLIWESFERCRPHRPVREFVGHASNVFCTAWAPDNRHLFSCGNDSQILRYDVESGPEPVHQFQHEDAVHKVALNPENADIFISASHDFTMKLWDVRTGTQPLGSVVGLDAFNSVAICPANSNLFVSCDGSALCLWDLRKSFGPDQLPSLETARQSKQRVLRHYLAVCRHHSGLMYLPEMSGVAFNQRGTHFLCSVHKAVPLLYQLTSDRPLVAFHAPKYSNKVTQKSACFGGSDDQLVMCGSDDWGVYIWDIGHAKPQADDSVYKLRVSHRRRRAFAQMIKGMSRLPSQLPRGIQTNAQFTVDQPLHILRGHKSIVNNVDWNHAEPMIASAGVEKSIRLWSPWPMAPVEPRHSPPRIPHRVFSQTRVAALQDALTQAEGTGALGDQDGEANTLELFDYYTARMESDSGSALSDGSEQDWDAWAMDGNDLPRAAPLVTQPEEGEDQRFFSSSDEDAGNGYDQLDSDSDDSPPARPRQPTLSLSFTAATLLQHASNSMPLDHPDAFSSPNPARSPSQASQGSLYGPSKDALCGGPTVRSPLLTSTSLTSPAAESPPVAGSSQSFASSPSFVLSYLETHLRDAIGTPQEAPSPNAMSEAAFDPATPCSSPGLALTVPLDVDGPPAGDLGDMFDPADDEAVRKRPRSTAGSPDSVLRPSKRCE